MYSQNLYRIVDDHIPINAFKRLNKAKRWDYGYNKDYDVVVISKTGRIGQVYEIQNLKYKDHEKYIGKMLTVRFQNLTALGVPRFPVGVVIRDYE